VAVGEEVPFYWAGCLLQSSTAAPTEPRPHVAGGDFPSAGAARGLHVDEVLGNQEVVVKNLGPQLARLPGLAGMSVLASGGGADLQPGGAGAVYGDQARGWVASAQPEPGWGAAARPGGAPPRRRCSAVPLVLVVDDSITVRRVTQRLLQREGYRVALAADGLQALERLQQERRWWCCRTSRCRAWTASTWCATSARRALADLPVIMITSRIAEKHREHARELGVDHYLGKPYSEDELLAWWRTLRAQAPAGA
jgi:chemosensory pili system protein ChpA (sensor histidine kinase/response regulator)